MTIIGVLKEIYTTGKVPKEWYELEKSACYLTKAMYDERTTYGCDSTACTLVLNDDENENKTVLRVTNGKVVDSIADKYE